MRNALWRMFKLQQLLHLVHGVYFSDEFKILHTNNTYLCMKVLNPKRFYFTPQMYDIIFAKFLLKKTRYVNVCSKICSTFLNLVIWKNIFSFNVLVVEVEVRGVICCFHLLKDLFLSLLIIYTKGELNAK